MDEVKQFVEWAGLSSCACVVIGRFSRQMALTQTATGNGTQRRNLRLVLEQLSGRNAGSHQHSNRSWPCSGDFSLVRYYLQSYTKQLPNQVFSSCYRHLFQLIQVKEHTADNRPLSQSTSHPAPISSVKEFPPDLLAMDRHQFCEEN